MEWTNKQKSLYIGVLSVAAIALLFWHFSQMTPFIYLTNDDLFLKTIASGEMTGTPDGHLYYVGYPVGIVIATLYRLFPALPWYGLMLAAGIALPLMILTYQVLMARRGKVFTLVSLGLIPALSYGFFFLHIAELQFTTVTGIVGAAAILLFYRGEVSASAAQYLKQSLPFLLLSFWAVSIRYTAFIMFFPIIGMIAFGKWLDVAKDPEKKEKRIALIVLALSFFGCMLLSRGIERIAYGSDDWQEFAAYTDASETIYDYDGYPAYETHAQLYEELGITESSYEAAAHHYNILLEPQINRETMERLRDVAEEERIASAPGIIERLRLMAAAFVDRHTSYTDRPLNLLVYVLYAYLLLFAILTRNGMIVRDSGFLLIARMVIWAYLLYYGRLPSRVSQAVYFAELFVQVGILLRYTIAGEIRTGQKVLLAMLALLLCGMVVRFGIPKARAAQSEAISRRDFSEAFLELKSYMASNDENFYYLDMNSFGSFTEDGLLGGVNTYGNYVFMGSWVPHSPWYDAKFTREKITDPMQALLTDGSVYAVFMQTETTSWDYLESMIEETIPGSHLREADTYTTTNGLCFVFLQGEQAQK